MSGDRTEPNHGGSATTSISKVGSRVVPVSKVKTNVVEPRMTQAQRIFSALAVASNDPPLRLQTEFVLTGLGKLQTKTVGNFLLVDNNTPAGPGFVLSFEYRGREGIKFSTESERVYSSLRKGLFDANLVFKGAASATANRLIIEPVVPAAIDISADRAREKITIVLRNVAVLGTSRYELPVGRFDPPLINALVELVSTNDHAFYGLVAAKR
jgi:hypothetical protein